MDAEVHIISDGDDLAVIGEQEAVEGFLEAQELPSKDLGLPKLSSLLRRGSQVAQTGADVGANYGRWMKLT